jgi:hypothetical protein
MEIKMNKFLLPTFIFCFALAILGCGKKSTSTKSDEIQNKTTTKKFFNQDGKFRILFEQEPTAYSQYIPFESGKILMSYFIYEKGINLIYCISYADYPESFTNNKVASDLLADILVTYVDNQRAGLEVQKMITVGSYPGIYFKASNSDTFVYGEYILRKNRLYQLTVTKEGNYHNETEVMAFFNSLELM